MAIEMRKDIFRGYTEEQIKDMSIDDFMALIPARERRTLKRYLQNPPMKKLIEKVRKLREKGNTKKMIKTHVRDAVIIPEWLGLTFGVYNGKEFKKIVIKLDMLGKRLGEFAHSTGRVLHSGPGIGATRGSKFVSAK